MKKLILLAFILAAPQLIAQTDSTCAIITRLYNSLDSKDKVERARYKINPPEVREAAIGKLIIYKSSLAIPGFVEPEFREGSGSRVFTTYANADTYETAVKMWDDLNLKFHTNFTGGWTFTEYNEPTELYRNSKLMRDGSMLSPVIRYRLERFETKFRLIFEIAY
jgi:hypothetical protein